MLECINKKYFGRYFIFMMKLKKIGAIYEKCEVDASLTLLIFIVIFQPARNEDFDRNCTEDYNHLKSGSLFIPSDTVCSEYLYNFSTDNETSIISLKFKRSLSLIHSDIRVKSTSHKPNNFNVGSTLLSDINSTNLISDHLILTVAFEEFDEEINESVSLNEWKINPKDIKTKENIYLSRTSNVALRVKVQGNWTDYRVEIAYKEISLEFVENNHPFSTIIPAEYEKFKYRPNTISVYRILKPQLLNVTSISLTLWYLDIDDGIGEYLLIGAGVNPFEGPPALYLGDHHRSPKLFHVNNQNAYIVFVSRSFRKYFTGFRIDWSFNGTKIVDDEKEKKEKTKDEDILESMQICISNISAAVTEFSIQNGNFRRFRKDIAKIASDYARNRSLNTIISSEKISIYRVSAEEADADQGGLLYVMLKIQGSRKGKAAFTWEQLNEIFDEYMNTEQNPQDFKIKRCPTLHLNWTQSVGFYAIIPCVGCFLLFIWTWQYNPLSKYFMPHDMRKHRISGKGTIVDPNENVYDTSPFSQTDQRSRPFTMDFAETTFTEAEYEDGSSLQKYSIAPKHLVSNDTESAKCVLSGTDNEAFEEEQFCAAKSTNKEDTKQQENLYDTVKSYESGVSGKVYKTRL